MPTLFFALGVLVAVLIAIPAVGQPATEPAAAPSLKVVTFNIRYDNPRDGADAWPRRRELFLATLRAHDADVVGLQEVLDGQFRELKSAFPGYDLIGVGRDDGKRAGEYSPILIRRDRFELIATGTRWLSPTPEVVGSKGWDAALPRIATWARVRDRRSAGRELLLVNAHFDHEGRQARLESAKLIAALVAEHPGAAIITGDFNCYETDPPCQALATPESKLVDAYRAVYPERAPDEATFHGFKGGRAGQRIDFIYVRDMDVLGAEIDRTAEGERYPSDHFAVGATVRVR